MVRNYNDGDNLYGPEVTALLRDAFQGTSVVSGCAPTPGTNALDVDVSAGTVAVNSSTASVSATTVTLAARDSYDRIDLVSVASDGTVQTTTGTQELVSPNIPADNVLLSVVVVPQDGSGSPITVNDSRVVLSQAVYADLDVDGTLNLGTFTGSDPSTSSGGIWIRTDV